ncbi:MAG: tetratricopeptide repeat protein [Spirochaetales bacterium]|nr:tetratricopeptide repeat protein [Spirochaetales bacterium]
MSNKIFSKVNKAIYYSEKGNPKKCYSKLKKLDKKYPDNELINFNMAVACEKLEKNTKAEFFYRKALALCPDNSETLNSLGAFLIRKGELAEARSLLSEAVNIDKTKAIYWNNLGVVNFLQTDYQAAVGNFKIACAIDSENPDIWYNLRDSYEEIGEKELAKQAEKNYQRLTGEQ